MGTDRKDDIFMQRRLYIDAAHGAGHIPHCASNTTFVVLVLIGLGLVGDAVVISFKAFNTIKVFRDLLSKQYPHFFTKENIIKKIFQMGSSVELNTKKNDVIKLKIFKITGNIHKVLNC